MTKIRLSDEEWAQIQAYLRTRKDVKVGSARACRRFVEGVLWVLRSGAQWRLLPRKYGKWNSVYKRFARWCESGVWDGMLRVLGSDADMETVMLDSTVVRAHPCAAGALKKTVGKPRKRWDAAEGASRPKSM